MKIVESTLAGAFIIEPEPFVDDRGFFARTFCRKEFSRIRGSIEFVQSNMSYNKNTGTTRGLHYQYPPYAEDKLVSCIAGAALDVFVDIRQGSPTFLQFEQVELSTDNNRMIYIPAGFAHGFQTLQDDTRMCYHHTAYYTPNAEGGLRFDDPRLGIPWPLTDVIQSDKDKAYPFLDSSFHGVAIK